MAASAGESRQGSFEAVVGLMLESLETIFVESVEVERKPRIAVDGAEEVELAFELTYTTSEQPHRWLIECEHSGTEEAVDRLIAARSAEGEGSDRVEDRLVFLYHLERALAGDLRRTLDAEKIEHYSLKEFGIRLDEINIALAEDSGQDKTLFRLELMKSSRQYPALRAAFSRMRVTS